MRLNGASAERADFKPYLNFYTYSSLSGSTEYNSIMNMKAYERGEKTLLGLTSNL